MTNEELLQKLTEIVRAEIRAETDPINKRLNSIENRLLVLDAGQKNLEEGLNVVVEGVNILATEQKTLGGDITELFHETWEKMDKQNERISVIEDHLDLKHPSKN